MEITFPDDYLDKLPGTSSISTIASEGSLDEVHILKQTNDNLRKELEKTQEEYRSMKKIVEQQSGKNHQIEELKLTLSKMTEEIDDLQQKLKEATHKKIPKHKPVPNPLQTVLINQLQDEGIIKSKEVEEVMRSIDRGDFAPKDAYVDRAQQLGFNTTISAPHMHAIQLEILKECFNDAKTAIDIGTGSGYVALSLAKMMKGTGKVYAVDHIPKLLDQARENICKNHKEYVDEGRIEFICADGREGLPQHAPYDIMFVGGAVKEVPQCLIDQLSIGGSIVIPVGEFFQYLTVIHKTLSGKVERNAVMSVMFGKLQSVEEQCPDIDE